MEPFQARDPSPPVSSEDVVVIPHKPSLRDCAHRPNKVREREWLCNHNPSWRFPRTMLVFLENPSDGAVLRALVQHFGLPRLLARDEKGVPLIRIVPCCTPTMPGSADKDALSEATLRYYDEMAALGVCILRGKHWNASKNIFLDEESIRDLVRPLPDEGVVVWHDATTRLCRQRISDIAAYIHHFRINLRGIAINFSIMMLPAQDAEALMRLLDAKLRGAAFHWQLDILETRSEKPFPYIAVHGGSLMMRATYTFKYTPGLLDGALHTQICDVCNELHYRDSAVLCDVCDRAYHRGCLDPAHVPPDDDTWFECPPHMGCADAPSRRNAGPGPFGLCCSDDVTR